MICIESVIKKQLCSGCGLCASMFPDNIEMNKDGFFNRPKIKKNLNKKDMNVFSHICPGINQSAPGKAKYINQHVIWGNYKNSYTGYSNDEKIRYKASSGGILSQTAIHLLEKHMVDGVIHIKADPSNPIMNLASVSFTPNEVLSGAGSRYSPASPLENCLQVLNMYPNKKFCFIGKPCDVTALRNLMKIQKDISKRVPYLLSFFCAGTPSRDGVVHLLKKLKVEPKDIIKFDFRGNGWPGKTTVETLKDKKEMSYSESWGDILGPTIQHRCKICADGIGENADLVSADVWHSDENGYPLFEESDGEGLVLPRTNNGNLLVESMKEQQAVCLKPYSLDSLKSVQPTQYDRKGTFLVRALAKLATQYTIPRFSGQRGFSAALEIGLYKNFKSFLGSLLRSKQGKL
ncbi:Coenzyme F420 hydrogenase/dehydrogenase, beta subunit C-terminal domain [Vibrio olivae]|uniref:Coenzyme F420 hydrogenase/dehydrogenase, beta subunit C-terminal domain n=1 Tax=Vibrio olivae TaxID=1243002 RepID=A0ABV5HQ70_9VIBR